jgi:hypothetical protein
MAGLAVRKTASLRSPMAPAIRICLPVNHEDVDGRNKSAMTKTYGIIFRQNIVNVRVVCADYF